MKTTTGDCKSTQTVSKPHECLPCEIPPLCRNHFFTGKLMTARDFTDEQSYLVDMQRLHELELHGWGVVCGLRVKPHPYCPHLRIVVEPGFAIDRCGRQIRVIEETEKALPQIAPPPPPDPCPPESAAAQAVPTEELPAQEAGRPAAQPEEKAPDECETGVTLYVCLSYSECKTEWKPAPFDECGCNCNGGKQKPNRICEGYQIVITTQEPEGLSDLRKDRDSCDVQECEYLYEGLLDDCLTPKKLKCIPLAVIEGYVPGKPIVEKMIDNWECRPLLVSTRFLERLIRCILHKLPVGGLTHIVGMNWHHGEHYHCGHFMSHYVGEEAFPRHFEVNFSQPVRTDALSHQSFQAIAIRYKDRAREGGFLEVLPARVWAPDPTTFCLRIDRGYAERHLNGVNFDLYLTLRCDVILDERGNPVDGNLLAHPDDGVSVVRPPTGDGIAGGPFESWIHVRA
jgi:hypothetical protein